MANTRTEGLQHKAQYRIPLELAEWLRAQAIANTRTVNGELIARLKESRRRDTQEASNAT